MFRLSSFHWSSQPGGCELRQADCDYDAAGGPVDGSWGSHRGCIHLGDRRNPRAAAYLLQNVQS